MKNSICCGIALGETIGNSYVISIYATEPSFSFPYLAHARQADTLALIIVVDSTVSQRRVESVHFVVHAVEEEALAYRRVSVVVSLKEASA